MVHLELSEKEAKTLKHAIDTYVSMTYDETTHTVNREYKSALKEQMDLLKSLSSRIERETPQNEVA
jgi:hypothetical protein